MLDITNYQEDVPEILEDYLMTVQEVAREFRVDPTTVRRWIHAGSIEGVALPSSGKKRLGAYRVWRSQVEKILSPVK